MTETAQEPKESPADLAWLWSQVGEMLITGHAGTHSRLDRVEVAVGALATDVVVLQADVSQLKTDVAQLKTDVTQLKTDVAQLKVDVAQLKTDVTLLKADVAQLNDRVGRLEVAFDRGFRRMDAQFERLIGLIQCDEAR